MSMKILLIEDDLTISNYIKESLLECGFEVEQFFDGNLDLVAIKKDEFCLLILDIFLPNRDGFSILKEIRQMGNNIPIICLTAKSELSDRLQGFNLGADDYLIKPFFMEELISRIRVLLNRRNYIFSDVVAVGDVTINRSNCKVNWCGVSAKLSKKELVLLEYLMRSPNYIFSRNQIIEHIWKTGISIETNVVDVYIQRIRKKLDNKDQIPFPIEAVRGMGYRFCV